MDKNNNHIKLSRFHFALAVLYLVLIVLWQVLKGSYAYQITKYDVIFSLMFFLHMILSLGTRSKLEISRKLSVAIGVLMIFAFPVGTILAFYFLPYTEWDKNNQPTGTG